MEVSSKLEAFVDDLPDLDPVIAHEPTSYGWRGLTAHGEVLEVKSAGATVPEEIIVARGGRAIGRRAVSNEWPVDIDAYLLHFNAVVDCYKAGRLKEALDWSDATMSLAATLRAKFNRAMILLAGGNWREGLQQYWQCEQLAPFMRPPVRAALDRGLRPWRGEDLRGKRLRVMHAHGFGDSIMMLRYLPVLRRMGAEVMLDVPPELDGLTSIGWRAVSDDCDYFCPILHLLYWLDVTPENISSVPYIAVPQNHVCRDIRRRRIGVAWSIGKPSDGDYPREIPLSELVAAFPNADLYSVQIQNCDEAEASGVHAFWFKDFAECAALMMTMDAIVSVDTAALHLAGAIGHPRVFGLLSHWASWRWCARWYDNVTLCRQATPGDWSSALTQIYAR